MTAICYYQIDMRFKFGFYTLVSFFLFLILFSSITMSSNAKSIPLFTNETQIPVHESWKEGKLAIYGDKIVWMDMAEDIYMYDLATSKETKLTNNPKTYGFGYDSGFCIYDDKIVWQSLYGETINIYNTSTQVESKLAEESGKSHPAIYKTLIVWEDNRNGKMNEYGYVEGEDIYMYDLSTYEETQISTSGSAFNPAIYGDRIVWSDNRSGNEGDIYLYNLSTSKEIQITNTGRADYAKIYGDRIVWEDNRSGIESNIYMYNLSTNKETQITTDNSDQHTPDIYGDSIVWEDDRNGGWYTSNIYMYDLSNFEEIQITSDPIRHQSPAINGNRIAWMVRHYRDTNATVDIYTTNINSNLQATSSSVSPISGTTSLNTSIEKSIVNNFWKQVDALTDILNLERILAILASIVTILAFIISFLARSHKKPKIISFEVNPAKIISGDSTTLIWSVSDATHVTITPEIGNSALTGSISVSPAEDTIYTLTAINKAGENSVTRKVFVGNSSAKDSPTIGT